MGFELDSYFVLDDAALAAYDALCPGVLDHAIMCLGSADAGVPLGIALPSPSDLQYEVRDSEFDCARCEARFEQAGMTRAHLPKLLESDQLFWGSVDYLVAWAMSLVSERGVTMMRDNTHGGVLIDEYALCWQRGELALAQGVSHDSSDRIHWQSARNLALLGDVRESMDPISWALTSMDEHFLDVFLFDGYLPRDMDSAIWSPTPWTRPLPRITEEQVWAAVSNWVEQHPNLS